MKMNMGATHVPTLIIAVIAFLAILGVYHLATKK